MASEYNEGRNQTEIGNNRLLDLIYGRFKIRLEREFKRTYKAAFEDFDENGTVSDQIFETHENNIYELLYDVIFRSMRSGSERLLNTFIKAGWLDKKSASEYIKNKRVEYGLYSEDRAKRNARLIAATTKKDINSILIKATEEKGLLGDKIKALLFKAEQRSIYRSIVVGFTNIHGALNFSQGSAARDNQDPEYDYYKIWVTEKDEKVRTTAKGAEFDHVAMEGVSVLTDQKFFVTKEYIDGPGDENGSLANIINCRCFCRHRRELKA